MLVETSVPYSAARIKSDLTLIDQLADMMTKLELQIDVNMLEMFQRLQDLAGSREFHPIYSQIHHFVFKLKLAREGYWDSGYIVPWMSVYSLPHIGINSHLIGVATHYCGNTPIKDGSFTSPTLIKSPPNPFGNGMRPVELNRDEWNHMLSSFLVCSPRPSPLSSSLRSTATAPSSQATGGKRSMPSPTVGSASGANLMASNVMNRHFNQLQDSHPYSSTGHAQKKVRLAGMGATSPSINGTLGSISLSPTEVALLTAQMNNTPDYNAILNHVLMTVDSKSPQKSAESLSIEPEPIKKSAKSRRQNNRPVKQSGIVIPSIATTDTATSVPLNPSVGGHAPQVAPAADDV
jgi:hypothetical protein